MEEREKRNTITLTENEKSKLEMFLLLSTQFRKREYETALELSVEKKEDGTAMFPSMKSNAEWWNETSQTIEIILKKLREY